MALAGETIAPIKSPYAGLIDASRAANPNAGFGPSPNVDYGFGTQADPKAADPNAPFSPLPLTPNKPFDAKAAAGIGGQFDYSFDPILQQVKAAHVKADADAEATALAQRQQALIAYGYDPGADAKGLYGDQSTADAAKANPFSTLANLGHQESLRELAANEGLNKQNLFYSSTRGSRLGELGRSYLESLSGASGNLQNQLGSYASGLAGVKEQGIQNELAAEEAAYQRALQFSIQYGAAADKAAADQAAADQAAADQAAADKAAADKAAADKAAADKAAADQAAADQGNFGDLDPAIATAIAARTAAQPPPPPPSFVPPLPPAAPPPPPSFVPPLPPAAGISARPRALGPPVFAAPAVQAPVSPELAAVIRALTGGPAPKPKPAPTPAYKGRH